MNQESLLPCPNCGSDHLYTNETNYYDLELKAVACSSCRMIGPKHPSEEKIVELWNKLPRALRWTKEKPTVPGIYWARINDKEPGIICVDVLPEGPLAGKMACYIMRLTEDVLLEDVNKETEWAGPIQEPMEK